MPTFNAPSIEALPPFALMKESPVFMSNGLKSQLQPVKLDTLVQEAESFARKSIERDGLGEVFHVAVIARRDALDKFAAKHAALLGAEAKCATPAFAFHGTWNNDFMPSIVENGLLPPGSFTDTGMYIHQSNGAIFGCGIYVSPSSSLANCYSFEDEMENRQLIVCLVVPGNVKYLRYETKEEHEYLAEHVVNKAIHEGYDSHVVVGSKIVLREATQVFPLLLVSYGQRTNIAQQSASIASQLSKLTPPTKVPPSISARPLITPANPQPENQPDFQNYWTLTVTSDLIHNLGMNCDTYNTHLHLLIDRSKSIGRSAFRNLVLPACSLILTKFQPQRADAIFFGSTVEQHTNVNSSFFSARADITGMELQFGSHLLEAYSRAVNTALQCVESEKRKFEDDVKVHIEQNLMNELAKQRQLEEDNYERLIPEKKEHHEPPAHLRLSKEVLEDKDFKMKEKAIREEFRKGRRQTLHVFILLNAGDDSNHDEDEMDRVFTDFNKKLVGAGVLSMLRVIGIGKKFNPRVPLMAHMATETLHTSATMSPITVCSKVYEIPVAAANLGSSFAALLAGFSISAVNSHVLSGFIHRWTNPPVNRVSTAIPSAGKSKLILYKGHTMPPVLEINGRRVKVVLDPVSQAKLTAENDSKSNGDTEAHESINRMLNLLREYTIDLKIAAITRLDHQTSVKELLRIWALVKNEIITSYSLGTGASRLRLMREKRGLMMDIDALLNSVTVDCAAAMGSLNNEDSMRWLAPVRSMKFAADAIRRHEMQTNDDSASQEVEFREDAAKIIEWVKENPGFNDGESKQLISKQSNCSEAQHLQEIARMDTRKLSARDFLYSCGMVGIGIQVARTQASIVNPWLMVVKYVSCDFVDTASSMCMLHSGVKWVDQMGNEVEDVLILANPQNDIFYKLLTSLSLYKAYTSITCTRNPDLYTPQQRVALLGISFVTAIEQLYQSHPDMNTSAIALESQIENVLHMAFTLRKYRSNSSAWTSYLEKLLLPNPSHHLTEADDTQDSHGIASVAQVLVALGCIACFEVDSHQPSGFGLLSNPAKKGQLADVALAILSESISRGCRIKIKSSGLPTEPLEIRSRRHARIALSISSEEFDDSGMVPVPDIQSWITSGKKQSGKFFKNPFWRCNASPQAVSACLSFSKTCASYWQQNRLGSLEQTLQDADSRADLIATIANAVSKYGGMREFLTLYSEDVSNVLDDGQTTVASKDLLQIALYVQGLRFYDSKTRRRDSLLSLNNPLAVIRTLIQTERLQLQREWIHAQKQKISIMNKEHARSAKRSLQLLEQAEFLKLHSRPRLFSHVEVMTLNQGRPMNDQLEVLNDSGLLKHHCSCAECPEYLVNQSTERDRMFNRREGIYSHLKWLLLPERKYANAYHVVLRHMVVRHLKDGGKSMPASIVFERVWDEFCAHPKIKGKVAREGRASMEPEARDAVDQYVRLLT
ncbi:hypothetical protein HDU81_000515 [Chytriomyces hyalinus]|nr:hypothetical protein HDU81_000515 [Chytriomyces hyalinus]